MRFDCTGSQQETIRQLAIDGDKRRVLDVGCGDGRIASIVAPHVKLTLGVDPDAGTLRRAANQAACGNLAFQAARAESLCFADGAFDAVLLIESLHHVAPGDQPQALEECRRVLKTGGRLLILEPDQADEGTGARGDLFAAENAAKQSAAAAIEAVVGLGFNLAARQRIPAVYACRDIDDLERYCEGTHATSGWSEHCRREVAQELDRCARDARGYYLIPYQDAVWLLIKH